MAEVYLGVSLNCSQVQEPFCQDNQTIRTMHLCKALPVYPVEKKFEGEK